MLAWGDERGRVNFFELADSWGNFEKKAGAAEIGAGRIAGMSPMPSYATHTDWVTKLWFMSLTDSLLSASMDSTLVLTDLTRERVKWSVREHVNGVHSFAYCQVDDALGGRGGEGSRRLAARGHAGRQTIPLPCPTAPLFIASRRCSTSSRRAAGRGTWCCTAT